MNNAALNITAPAKIALHKTCIMALGLMLEELEYDPSWANKTGYFDGLLEQPEALPQANKVYTTLDPHGRRLFMVRRETQPTQDEGSEGELPTIQHVSVIFERYNDTSGSDQRLVFQGEAALKELLEIETNCVYLNNMQMFFVAFGPEKAEKLMNDYAANPDMFLSQDEIAAREAATQNTNTTNGQSANQEKVMQNQSENQTVNNNDAAPQTAEQIQAQIDATNAQIEKERSKLNDKAPKTKNVLGDDEDSIFTTRNAMLVGGGLLVGGAIGYGLARYLQD